MPVGSQVGFVNGVWLNIEKHVSAGLSVLQKIMPPKPLSLSR